MSRLKVSLTQRRIPSTSNLCLIITLTVHNLVDMCVCVCVGRERKKERERHTHRQRQRETRGVGNISAFFPISSFPQTSSSSNLALLSISKEARPLQDKNINLVSLHFRNSRDFRFLSMRNLQASRKERRRP